MWNYRLVYDGKRVFVAEVFYNTDSTPELYIDAIELDGYDWNNPDLNDMNACADDLKGMLKMILADIERNPTILRVGVDVNNLDDRFNKLSGENDD